MAESALWELVLRAGLPLALVVTALLAGRNGTWVWGREVDAMRSDFEAQLSEARKDRDFYREIAFRALDQAAGGARVAERAVNARERGA